MNKRGKAIAYSNYPSPTLVMNARLCELAVGISQKQSAPLLTMPTHWGGWIDPRVFIERVIYYQNMKIDIPKHDFTQALLRLSPDFWEEALERATVISGSTGDVVRWALGGNEFPRKFSKREKELWITAGRCRNPRKLLDELSGFRKFKNYPDGIVPAKYEWKTYLKKAYHDWEKKEYYIPSLDISSGVKKKRQQVSVDIPSTMLHLQYRDSKWSIYYGYNAHVPWLVRWFGMIWPQNTDALCVASIKAMMQRIDMNSSVYDPNFAYIDVLFEPDRPLTEMAILMIWMGLIGRDADLRGYAIDILSETVQDGRAHPKRFGKVFVKLCQGGWIKLNRVHDSLKEVARLSPLHGYIVTAVLKQWLAEQNRLPRDGYYLLSLLLELLTRLGCSLDKNEKQALVSIKGSSKTAKFAKALLKYKLHERMTEHKKAMLQQLEARVVRAERWQEALKARGKLQLES